MPSPDVIEYLGLELAQLDEPTLIENALARLAAVFPDYEPRAGNTEYVLIEALAGIMAELGYVVNNLPNGLTEVLLRLFGLERDQGSPPFVAAQFTANDTLGHTIPKGTTFRLDMGDDQEPLEFILNVDVTISAGYSTNSTTGLIASEARTSANGIPAGKTLEALDSLSFLNTAVTTTPVGGGRDPEDGDAFLDRAIPYLRSLTTTLGRPDDIEAYLAAKYPDAKRVRVLDSSQQNPALAGSFLVLMGAAGGGQLPTSLLTAALTDLREKVIAGISLGMTVFIPIPVGVTVSLRTFAGQLAGDVQARVTAALNAYIDPDTWPYGQTISRTELIGVVDRVPGVDAVTALTITIATAFYVPTYVSIDPVSGDLGINSNLVNVRLDVPNTVVNVTIGT